MQLRHFRCIGSETCWYKVAFSYSTTDEVTRTYEKCGWIPPFNVSIGETATRYSKLHKKLETVLNSIR